MEVDPGYTGDSGATPPNPHGWARALNSAVQTPASGLGWFSGHLFGLLSQPMLPGLALQPR